jgi:hypothetical protein
MAEKYEKNKVIGPLIATLVELHKSEPEVFDSPERIKAVLVRQFPQLKDHTKCPNCDASMVKYDFKFDNLDARTLLAMAKVVRSKMNKGLNFTDANKVHVQSEITESYAAKSRTTQMSKLGLITKVKVKKDGKLVHDTKAGWLITKRGWEALSGKPVPKVVTVFRNEIVERSEDTITLSKALEDRPDEWYDPKEWVTYAGYSEGQII